MEAIQKIKRNQIQSVYMLRGTEQYFIDLFKSAIQKQLQEKVNDDFVTIDLTEVAVQDVIIDAETLPFFNEHKLIFALDPTFLKTKAEKTPLQHDLARLEQYVQSPAPFTTLVIIAPYEKIDERKKISKLLKKHVTNVDCQPIKQSELRKWMQQIASAYEVTFDEQVLALLESEFESNLFMLQKEMEKLATFAGENHHVTIQDTYELMSQSLTGNALQLVDAVLKRNMKDAFIIYKNIQKMGEEPIGLIALLGSQFRNILQAKILKQKGYPLQMIQSEIKAHPYAVKLAVERSNAYHVNQLEKMISLLTRTDEKMKRGEMEQNIAFEMLLYDLIHLS